MNIRTSLVTAALLVPGFSAAEDMSANGLAYDYVGIGYGQVMVDTTFRATFHGLSLEGSKKINEDIFLFGTYFDMSADKVKFLGNSLNINVNYSQYQLGGGYRRPLEPGTDLIATLSVVRGSTRVSGRSNADNIYPVSLGVKHKFAGRFEDWEGSAEGIVADGNLGSLFQLQRKISDLYSIGGYYRHDKNSDIYALNIRFLF